MSKRYTLANLRADVERFNQELEQIGSIWRLQVKWYSDVSHLYCGTVADLENHSVSHSLINGLPRECLVRAEQFLLDEYRDKSKGDL